MSGFLQAFFWRPKVRYATIYSVSNLQEHMTLLIGRVRKLEEEVELLTRADAVVKRLEESAPATVTRKAAKKPRKRK